MKSLFSGDNYFFTVNQFLFQKYAVIVCKEKVLRNNSHPKNTITGLGV